MEQAASQTLMENILLFKNEKVIQQNGNQSPRILEVKHISTRELIAHDVCLTISYSKLILKILLGKRFLAYDSPLDLVYVLYHREFEKKFREYLEKTYCSENFNFWVAAVQYSKTKNAQFRIEMATTIMETFFNDSKTTKQKDVHICLCFSSF